MENLLPKDTNDVQICLGDTIEFSDLIWGGYGSVSYPRRRGIVKMYEMEGKMIPVIDFSLGMHERIEFFTGEAYKKYLVINSVGND